MIIGHHPHVVQPIEFYKNKLIAYSLGDFIFDHINIDRSNGIILHCKIKKGRITSAKQIKLKKIMKYFPSPIR